MPSEILVIDDEQAILNVIKILIENKFPDLKCTTFDKASPQLFKYASETKNNIILIISDVQLPGISNIVDIAKTLHSITRAVFLFISGHGYDYKYFDKLLGSSCIYDFMAKPCSLPNLESKIRTLLNISKSYKKVSSQLDTISKTLAAITEHSSDSTLIIDSEGFIKYTSPSIKQFTLCSDEKECTGMKFSDLCNSDYSKEIFKEAFENILCSKNGESLLVTNIDIKNEIGNDITFDCRLTNMLTTEGVEGIVINTRETTLEGKLRSSIWDIFNYLNFFLVFLDIDMNIVLANHYLSDFLGYESEYDLIGRNWKQFLAPDETELVEHVHHKNLDVKNKDFREFLNKIRSKDGTIIEVRWFNCPVINGVSGTFSIGIPGDEISSVESMRAYWRDIIEKDKTAIKAMRSLFKSKENGANTC